MAHLTKAQRRVLIALAATKEWLRPGQETDPARGTIHAATANRLRGLGFVKRRAEVPWLGVIDDGADLVRYLGHWRSHYQITPAGRKALRS